MKRYIAILLAAVLVLNLAACGVKEETGLSEINASLHNESDIPAASESDAPAAEGTDVAGSRVLIAYFSVLEDVSTDGVDAVAGASIVVKDGEKLGNTEYVAKLIEQIIGGDLFRIETVEPYPLEHDILVDQADEEKADAARPKLATQVENFDQYEIILLGYPNWWADLPMPLYTFLESYDFDAKTIIPFVTHGGSGASRTIDTISKLQPGANVEENSLILSRNDVANSEKTVVQWAESLSIQSQAPQSNSSGDTVATAIVTPGEKQVLYLWEEGNVPATTEYTVNNGNYSDVPDFRRYITTFPVPEGTKIKGAVLICAGGAFQFRSDRNEGSPEAEELSKLGYQSFVVDYRLRPYTQEEITEALT